MKKIAVVTGAGSGVGRAVAIALVKAQWNVVLVGRRETALRQTQRVARRYNPHGCLICPCDIGDAEAVKAMAAKVGKELGNPEVLVNAAGTNTKARSLKEVSPEDYRRLLDTNLDGAYYCVQAFLPAMRTQRRGTIVNVVSDAGKLANAKAGVAYVMSKFGLTGLTQSINAEERANGVRACAVFPGEIDTPILDLRPVPPSEEARAKMLQAEDVADCVMLAVQLPARAIVEEMLIRPA